MAGGLRVLVAEDHASVLRSIGRLLRAAGFEYSGHDSAERLLQSEDPQAWDCVVADIHLPGLSGFDLVDALRRARPGMPAVFVTANDDAKTRERALRQYQAEYLTKPFEGTALFNAIRKVTFT